MLRSLHKKIKKNKVSYLATNQLKYIESNTVKLQSGFLALCLFYFSNFLIVKSQINMEASNVNAVIICFTT